MLKYRHMKNPIQLMIPAEEYFLGDEFWTATGEYVSQVHVGHVTLYI